MPELPTIAADLLLSRKAIAFDLDGTLVDSVADLRMAAHLALLECGHPGLPDDYRMPNLHGVFPALIHAVMRDRGVSDDELGPVSQAYARHYNELGHKQSRLYPGVKALLDECRSRGVPMAVCTNKMRAPALMVLENCGILDYFVDVAGSDTVAQPKPEPMALLRAFGIMGAVPQDCCYVGYTHIDAISSARAGTPFVLHQGGYGDPSLLSGQPVAAVFADYEELTGALAD